jgi:hypothetical protein
VGIGSGQKQRSPAGGRWAGGKIHQIEKMNHCEESIVGVRAIRVKPTGATTVGALDAVPVSGPARNERKMLERGKSEWKSCRSAGVFNGKRIDSSGRVPYTRRVFHTPFSRTKKESDCACFL